MRMCLVEKETREGPSNLFDCIFGQEDRWGFFSCSDTRERRKQLSKWVADVLVENADLKDTLLESLIGFIILAENPLQYPNAGGILKQWQKFEAEIETTLSQCSNEEWYVDKGDTGEVAFQ